MAYLTLNTDKLKQNYHHLNTLFQRSDVQWSVVTKLLCGNELYLKALSDLCIPQVCDSRLANLKTVRNILPGAQTVLIKPPAMRNARKVIDYADISCNTSIATIAELSKAAHAAGKTHQVIIMIETGELREGILPENLAAFYDEVRSLTNIEIIGLGTNHACMHGVLPSYENLKTLESCRQELEEKFGRRLELLSGGASVAIPLLISNKLPDSINHFRIGETLFFGTNVYENSSMPGMHQDIFTLHTSIIELRRKPSIPYGSLGYNLTKEKSQHSSNRPSQPRARAIVDVGLLDIDMKHLTPVDPSIQIVGASSDMLVIDVGANVKGRKVGDNVSFKLDYMGTLRAISSQYVEKRVLNYESLYKQHRTLAALN